MLDKKDYLEFFGRILRVEVGMKNEGRRLLEIIEEKKSQTLLKKLVADEIRHEKIVREMIKIVK